MSDAQPHEHPRGRVCVVSAADLVDPGPGTRVVELDGVSDEATFHDQIADALGFPDYYGRNLDALWDCLGELADSVELRWSGWMPFAVAHPKAWARVMSVLTDRAAEPGFTLVCVT